MNAYDYKKQRWVEGPDAASLRVKQLTQDLQLLTGPKGQDFLNFTGSKTPLAYAISNCRQRLTEAMKATQH